MDRRLRPASGRARLDQWPATIVYRWAEGRSETYAEAAAEFVRLKVDVIVSSGVATPAMKQATSVIPIVFTLDADPVGRGLVASLARPGGNVTGLSSQSTELVGKRLELLREIVPGFRRLAVLTNVGFFGSAQEVGEIRAAARKLGVDIVDMLEVRKPEDITPAFAALTGKAQALYVCADNLTNVFQNRINILALGARLPTMLNNQTFLPTGGFISYGPNFPDLFRRALRGQDFARREARRSACRAAHEVRHGGQRDDCESAGAESPRGYPRSRRRGDRIAMLFAAARNVGFCAGFRLPAMRNLSTRSGGRRPKSAKARNRGQWCSGGAAGAMGIWPRGMA